MSSINTRKNVLNTLKEKTNFFEAMSVSISLFNSEYEEIGKLTPVGLWSLENPTYIERMVLWRKQHAPMFLSQFPVTFEGTYKHIKETIIAADNRLLFFIFDKELSFIGHIGIIVSESYVEIDNVIKDNSCNYKAMMYFALCALLRWCIKNQIGENFILHVLSYNKRAISLYRKVGFEILTDYFLFKEKIDEKINHKIVHKAEESNCPYTYQKMILPKK